MRPRRSSARRLRQHQRLAWCCRRRGLTGALAQLDAATIRAYSHAATGCKWHRAIRKRPELRDSGCGGAAENLSTAPIPARIDRRRSPWPCRRRHRCGSLERGGRLAIPRSSRRPRRIRSCGPLNSLLIDNLTEEHLVHATTAGGSRAPCRPRCRDRRTVGGRTCTRRIQRGLRATPVRRGAPVLRQRSHAGARARRRLPSLLHRGPHRRAGSSRATRWTSGMPPRSI